METPLSSSPGDQSPPPVRVLHTDAQQGQRARVSRRFSGRSPSTAPTAIFLLLSLWSLAVDLNIRGDRDLVGRLMAPAPQMDRK